MLLDAQTNKRFNAVTKKLCLFLGRFSKNVYLCTRLSQSFRGQDGSDMMES